MAPLGREAQAAELINDRGLRLRQVQTQLRAAMELPPERDHTGVHRPRRFNEFVDGASIGSRHGRRSLRGPGGRRLITTVA